LWLVFFRAGTCGTAASGAVFLSVEGHDRVMVGCDSAFFSAGSLKMHHDKLLSRVTFLPEP
jgi:hypothetical protein